MSGNKGKNGEMRVLRLLTHIVEAVENCDITRHTNTNTADGGADLILEHPLGLLSHLDQIANRHTEHHPSDLEDSPRVKTRIDVKNTSNKISPDIVKKFGGDIRRNPDCIGHALAGGSELSPQAEIDFRVIQEAQREVGKTVVYLPNSGIENLEKYYLFLPNNNDKTKK
jgi:hypothetical protein